MIQPIKDAFAQVRELLPQLSPAQKVRLLHDVAMDLDDYAPGIERTPDVCGGDACIVRTRIPVWLLEQARRLGSPDQEILDVYPALRQDDLANAWTYVASHAEEIDEAIRENEAD